MEKRLFGLSSEEFMKRCKESVERKRAAVAEAKECLKAMRLATA